MEALKIVATSWPLAAVTIAGIGALLVRHILRQVTRSREHELSLRASNARSVTTRD